MPTCPNCGEIIMNGDPYCPNCGTTFRWTHEEDEMTPISGFKSNMQFAKSLYEKGEYSLAFTIIRVAEDYYKLLTNEELELIGNDDLTQDWVCETCCHLFNQRDSSISAITEFIKENGIILNSCDDCNMFFPITTPNAGTVESPLNF